MCARLAGGRRYGPVTRIWVRGWPRGRAACWGFSGRFSAVSLGCGCSGAGGWPGTGLGVVPGGEPSGAVALAVEGLGWFGGGFGCPGQDLGEQAQQVFPFAAAEGGQDALLDGADAGEQLVGGGAALGG